MYVSKKWLAVFVVLIFAAGIAAFWLRDQNFQEQGPSASNDIPVVIRTNGGMLEIATIKHRRSFDLSKDPTFAGVRLPFCKEMATYTVDAAITYRVKLAKRWVGDYSGGKLRFTVPPPEPAIPVSFDTSRLRATLDSCSFMWNLNTKDDLLRSMSGLLAQDARGAQYMKLARGNEGRATISEFVRKWAMLRRNGIPSDVPIEITYSDE